MIYALILGGFCLLVAVGVGGYYLGRYQSGLVNRIRTLTEQGRQETPPEPEKPVVTGGAYEPPKEVSTSADTKKAGLVETKTPERLDWEHSNELANLEHGT